jgi:probable blue pigment (indigoidine) exporter
VERLPAVAVSLLGLLSPVVAALLGLVVLGQTLAPPQLLGAAAVLMGIALPQLPVRHRAPADDTTRGKETDEHRHRNVPGSRPEGRRPGLPAS